MKIKNLLFIIATIALIYGIVRNQIPNNKSYDSNSRSFTDFTVTTLEGKTINTKDFRKDKVLVLKSGATWCPPCNAQIPHLKKVVDTYKNKEVVVLDVNSNEAKDLVMHHKKSSGINYDVARDTTNKIMQMYAVRTIPKVIVVDKKGSIRYDGGFTEFSTLQSLINKAK